MCFDFYLPRKALKANRVDNPLSIGLGSVVVSTKTTQPKFGKANGNKMIKKTNSPSQDEVLVGIVGTGSSRAPLDGVNFLTVCLQIVQTVIRLYAPNLEKPNIGVGK